MTDVERQTQERELNRFWNELLMPGADPDARNVDDTAVETLRHLHRMTQASLPGTAQARVDRAVSSWLVPSPLGPSNRHAAWPTAQSQVLSRGAADAVAQRRITPLNVAVPDGMRHLAKRSSWRSLPYASVVLVLFILSLVFLTYATPQAVQESGPIRLAISADSGKELLFELALPAEALPHGTRVSAGLDDYSLDPGKEADWEPAAGACCSGQRLTYVMEGALIISSAVDAHLIRSGVSLEPGTVPSGASVSLGPGDAFVSPFDAAFTSSNPGPGLARFLDISIIDGYFPLLSAPDEWTWHPDGDVTYGLFVPDQPSILRLDRVVLDPGAVLLPAPGTITQLGITIADNEPIETCGKDAIKNINDRPVTIHVVTLSPLGAASLPAFPEEQDPACVGAVPLDAGEPAS